ncbi:Peroxisome proliferator-activated receptor gamma coactivator-related protein 1 [Camelus dromedarius]|uniref:Peroxisome proliferator-activated receptor gamma coactivator-related protein 1 n=1 Tax=Camelus dromedarius TaxID=9838 RepID=A0A5N4DKX1_CAMDR|nr:Peroxisome proliferator-activated receptor gamma coactivator-related protein 1 [Camelus dromedarius]
MAECVGEGKKLNMKGCGVSLWRLLSDRLGVLLHEEGDDSGFVSLSRLGPCLRDKDLEMEELILQDGTLLGTMHSYMDASLISLIEDFGSLGEQSRLSLEDQNEVSLLTALTEILDNADSENLSPFDSIPDSELLVSPREGSSLHRLLSLSRTPPERDLITPADPLGSSTGSSRMNGVEMSLTDPPWDFSPPSFLETSSPKLPSWRPPRSRPRWGQSPPPQQRSDGEEEEEVAGFSSELLAGELNNSVSSIPDFPMHLACPEEEDKTATAEMAVQAAGDESISSLSELVRAMHPYCLPNLTHLTALEDELQEQPDDLTLPEDCVVLEIVGQAATAGNDLEIPVVVRQIPAGPQPVLLDDSLEASSALQLLMPTLEAETEAAVPKEALCPEKEGLSLDSKEKLQSACLLEPREVMEPVAPKGPQNPPANATLSSQRARKGRRKKNKEQPAACAESYARRLRSASRGQSTVVTEVTSQAGKLPQEDLQRGVGPSCGRGKPRAWARAWAAVLEKPSSGNLESSAGQASPAQEGPPDLYPNLVDPIQADPVSAHLLVESAQADPMPLDSVEADPTAVDPVLADPVPVAPALVDLASASSELVDPLPADPVLIDPVLADSAAIDPAVVVPISDDLPSVDPVLIIPVQVDSVPSDLAPADPVLVKKLSFRPNPRTQGPEDVVQAFISEIGIEASDLSSLLEQFEKSEGLTPPATPPHQLWKPLAAVSLLAKAKSPKSTAQEGTLKPEGVTEAKHPAAARFQEGVHGPSPVHVGSGDHDYCVRSRTPPKKTPALVIPEVGSRWNVKRHQDITIKPVLSLGPASPLPPCTAASQEPLDHRTSNEQADPPAPCLAPSALLSPEASPCRNDMNTRTPPDPSAKQQSVRCYRKACRLLKEVQLQFLWTFPKMLFLFLFLIFLFLFLILIIQFPKPVPLSIPTPEKYSSYRSHDHYQRQRVLQKERAIEERRVVFIGKIPGRMTRSELKQRFSVFGEIEECTIHFRVQGDNYGFVTYRYAEEAFAAIESGHKLRQADEQPFDLCFGGRRQFCKRSYSDLDSNREDFDPAPVKSKFDSLDFDTLLKQAQKNLRR